MSISMPKISAFAAGAGLAVMVCKGFHLFGVILFTANVIFALWKEGK